MKLILIFLLSLSLANSYELRRVSFEKFNFEDKIDEFKMFVSSFEESIKFDEKPSVGIIGGVKAKIGDFPHQVLIQTSTNLGQVKRCGGSIIDNSWIVTSAHCISDAKNPDSIEVRAGIVQVLDKSGQTRKATKFFTHPDFNREKNFATPDIGLIKIEALTFDEKVNKIALYPKNQNKVEPGKISGWGTLKNPESELPSDLYSLDTELYPNFNCKNMFNPFEDKKYITENKICALKSPGTGLCFGDLGSGLEINEDKTRYLVAVASYYVQCGGGYPDVYERVFPHLDWIKKIMNENKFPFSYRSYDLTGMPILTVQTYEKPNVGVINGNRAKIGDFPHQTLLHITSKTGMILRCGGSIIDNSWILTAAHCVVDSANHNSIKIHAGIVDILDNSGQQRNSKKIIIHPQYDHDNFVSTPDIAFIKVDPFTFDDRVNKISIYPSNLDENTNGKVSGWGFTDARRRSNLPNDLFYLDTNIQSNSRCKNTLAIFGHDKFITNNKVCAFKEKGKGFCQGDSGSGLEYTEGNTRYLIGVVSYNLNGCASGLPDVFERVYSNIEWIRKVMEENKFEMYFM